MKILIISGFLGAGKTTFIKILANKANTKFLVLENEFADIGVDGNILEDDELKVIEIADGCICCSMAGNFKYNIKNIYKQVNPEYLIIEPTGVAMLSSIIKNINALKDENTKIELLQPITLVDTSSFNEYSKNFESFFIDNFKNTGKILLTHLDNFYNLNYAKNFILNINPDLEIIDEDYRNFSKNFFAKILNTSIENKVLIGNFNLNEHFKLNSFSTKNFNFKNMDKFAFFMNELMNDTFGKVYRAKGVVNIEGNWGIFNLSYKNFDMEYTNKFKENKIIIIGNNLDIEKIKKFLAQIGEE